MIDPHGSNQVYEDFVEAVASKDLDIHHKRFRSNQEPWWYALELSEEGVLDRLTLFSGPKRVIIEEPRLLEPIYSLLDRSTLDPKARAV